MAVAAANHAEAPVESYTLTLSPEEAAAVKTLCRMGAIHTNAASKVTGGSYARELRNANVSAFQRAYHALAEAGA